MTIQNIGQEPAVSIAYIEEQAHATGPQPESRVVSGLTKWHAFSQSAALGLAGASFLPVDHIIAIAENCADTLIKVLSETGDLVDGNASASPIVYTENFVSQFYAGMDSQQRIQLGLTKREKLAMDFMKELLFARVQDAYRTFKGGDLHSSIPQKAVELTDALLSVWQNKRDAVPSDVQEKPPLHTLSPIQLAQSIKEFLTKHAKVRPDFDPSEDDEDERFASPDATLLLYAQERFEKGLLLPNGFSINSSWESGGYSPYSDTEGRKWHDSLVAACNAYNRSDVVKKD